MLGRFFSIVLVSSLIIGIYRNREGMFLERESNNILMDRQPVVVVGSGLSGLSATYHLVKNGVPVVLLEKAAMIGGNSIKASSGINGVNTQTQASFGVEDNVDIFLNDTLKSAGNCGHMELMQKLATEAVSTIGWLQKEFNLKLDYVSQLGGHSIPRTHRSSGALPPGYELVNAFTQKLEWYKTVNPGILNIHLNARVVDIKVTQENEVTAVQYEDADGIENVIWTNKVVICSGGFGGSKELLRKYLPSSVSLPTTNSPHTTGDGQIILSRLGGELVNMEQIQVHPTAFVDPVNPTCGTKFLAAEALRANGGILLSPVSKKRFVNELDTRLKVTAAIQAEIGDGFAYLVMSEQLYKGLQYHMDFYLSKDLVRRCTIEHFANNELGIPTKDLLKQLTVYSTSTVDEFNRTHRINGFGFTVEPETEIFYGKVTPAVHFTMGGIRINKDAQVLKQDGTLLAKGLYAAGEVAGGIHGANRLGGSSLLECVVFGTQAGRSIVEDQYAEGATKQNIMI